MCWSTGEKKRVRGVSPKEQDVGTPNCSSEVTKLVGSFRIGILTHCGTDLLLCKRPAPAEQSNSSICAVIIVSFLARH